MHVMLTGVGGNAEVERGHAVYGCRNGCMCIVQIFIIINCCIKLVPVVVV